ncbi:MAG: hypothetical protein BWY70_00236 [Bacteroidetes bacterium ADurb.Bin408]|nr:MAG: hypothetical protein BWY70_00236 [Bacteroidetes bacterium ADurb.Bin408]
MFRIISGVSIAILLLTPSFNQAQIKTKEAQTLKETDIVLTEIPVRYLQHPEYGKTRLANPQMQNSIELIHERTVDSRLFKNPDGSFTIVKSGEPMHYKDAEGWWRTIEVAFENDSVNTSLFYLNKQPNPISFDAKTAQIKMQLDESHNCLEYGNDLSFIQMAQNGEIISMQNINNIMGNVDKNNAKAEIINLFGGINMNIDFDLNRVKSNYAISSSSLIDSNAKWVSIRETVKLPAGWTLEYNTDNGTMTDGNWQGEVLIKNNTGEIKGRFIEPVYFDSDSDRNTNHIMGSYRVEHVNRDTYFLYLMVPASWLLAPERIYPVTLDPIATNDDPTIIASCFYPTYQSSTLGVAVPTGAQITNSYLLWEFTAVNNGALIEDQRSYVTGINGSTVVYYGYGTSAGTNQYTSNSSIGNGTATGTATYTFFSSRVWGGSACDNVYNYLNRRRVEVTYYQLINNNVIGDAQTICIGDVPAMLTGSTPTGGNGSYNYTWIQSTNGGQTWENVPPPGTGINYSPGNVTTTTCYKRIVQSDTLISESNIICITIQTAINPGTISNNQSICYNTAPSLFTGTAAGCGTPPYIYQWQIQPACSGAWSDIIGATNDTYIHPTPLTQTTCYRRVVTAGTQSGNSNTITVFVNPLPVVTFSGLQSFYCITQTSPVTLIGTPAGGTFSGQGMIGNTFTPSIAGIGIHPITYSYTDVNNCSDSSTISVTVDPCTGVEIIHNEDVLIYPNPASNLLFIETNTHTDACVISIYDIRGLLLKKLKNTGSKSQINISDLAAGMYYIRIETRRNITNKIFVKNYSSL